MSELFRHNPKCYALIVALENEHFALREAHQRYSSLSSEENRKYRARAAAAELKMRSTDARQIRQVSADSIQRLRQQHEAAEEERLRAWRHSQIEEYEYPSRPVSRDWPVRPCSAKRVLAPGKLSDLRHYADVLRLPGDKPLIHGTRILVRHRPRRGRDRGGSPSERLS
jgi:hypothetical protein